MWWREAGKGWGGGKVELNKGEKEGNAIKAVDLHRCWRKGERKGGKDGWVRGKE